VPRSLFFLLFTVSGFAGLIYESVWTHYLKLFLGHAAYAQTLVLALFMGGMAIGSWLCSRHGGRWRNLLAAYAAAEAAIGIAALVFHPVFVFATEWAYDSLLPAAGGPVAASMAKWLLAALLILPQSVLLGMTFPLMSAGLIRRYPDAPGGSIAMLYFTNSFGAAVGVLASGFVLVEHLGLPGTVRAAGAINLVLAALVWLLAREARPAGPVTERSAAAMPPSLFLAVALLTGAASFIYEIGWIRMLTLVLGASTHSFELMLSAFILGLAAGGLWIRRRIDAIADPVRFLGIVQVCMGLVALCTVPLYGRMFELMAQVIKALAKTDGGHALFLLSSHGIALLIMFPATFFAGMTLPLITYALLRAGHGEKSIGAVYASNTLGSIIGVMLAAHIGLPVLGLKGLIAAGAALDVLLGLYLLSRAGQRRTLGLSAGICAVLFAVLLNVFPLDQYAMASGVFRRGEIHTPPDASIVSHRDGKTATVTLMDFPEGRSLRTNGKSDGAIALDPALPRISDEVTMVLTAAVPMAIMPEAKRVAVIGIGTGLTTHTLLANPTLDAVDTIEIEPAMAEASRGFAPRNSNAFGDPRSRIVFDDAKTWFSTHGRASGGGYDIIISEPSNPWVSGVSSLFTREFYRLARRQLNKGGVLTQWFQLYEIDASLVASVMQALGEEFPDYVIYAATDNDLLIVAGERETLARPLADITRIPTVAQELRLVKVLTMGDLEMRRLGGKAVLAPLFASFDVPANSDYHPYLDLHAARHRFLQTSAAEITAMGLRRVPAIAMLEGRRADWTRPPSLGGGEFFEKIDALDQMLYARDSVFGESNLPPVELSPGLRRDLDMVRLNRGGCDAGFDAWFEPRFQIARAALPLLPAVQAAALWDRLSSPGCRGKLSEAQSAWMALMQAVARRDGRRMGELAERLLDTDAQHTAERRRYLITAGMTGYLAGGQKEKAQSVWQRHGVMLRVAADHTVRLLFAHAFPGRKLP
jgi:spermidine synthase